MEEDGMSNEKKDETKGETKMKCRMCHTAYFVPITPEQLRRWQAGALIQHAAPNLSAGQRELLISKTCDLCFTKLFGGNDCR
jgi:hypothetical protein